MPAAGGRARVQVARGPGASVFLALGRVAVKKVQERLSRVCDASCLFAGAAYRKKGIVTHSLADRGLLAWFGWHGSAINLIRRAQRRAFRLSDLSRLELLLEPTSIFFAPCTAGVDARWTATATAALPETDEARWLRWFPFFSKI